MKCVFKRRRKRKSCKKGKNNWKKSSQCAMFIPFMHGDKKKNLRKARRQVKKDAKKKLKNVRKEFRAARRAKRSLQVMGKFLPKIAKMLQGPLGKKLKAELEK